jgi:hypothetical protein
MAGGYSLFQFVMGGRIGITAVFLAERVFQDPCLRRYYI